MKILSYILVVFILVFPMVKPVIAASGVDYICPMHAQVHGHQGEKCPICSMDLVPAPPGQTSHDHMKMAPATTSANSLSLEVPRDVVLEKGKPITLKVRLSGTKDNDPVSFDQLKEVHTQRFHALIIDQSLSDYHHVHPIETEKKGEYSLTFTPQQSGDYRIWADVTPAATGKQEYVIADLKGRGQPDAAIKSLTDETTVNGLAFKLAFDAPLQAGQAAMGRLTVTKNGKSFNQLEPVMGAFAHIVGFNEDSKTVAHIHPMGEEPTLNNQRGGPNLEFHMEPSKPGFTKLFAQVRVGGKDIFAPFGLLVEKAK